MIDSALRKRLVCGERGIRSTFQQEVTRIWHVKMLYIQGSSITLGGKGMTAVGSDGINSIQSVDGCIGQR